MRLYSVYLLGHGRSPCDDLVLVEEGFSWPGFLFTFIWALWTRMWLPAMVIFSVVVLAGWGVRQFQLGENVEAGVTVLISLAIGLVGNDLRRWWLDHKGYQEVCMVSGRNAEDATRRFLDNADINRDGIYPGAYR